MKNLMISGAYRHFVKKKKKKRSQICIVANIACVDKNLISPSYLKTKSIITIIYYYYLPSIHTYYVWIGGGKGIVKITYLYSRCYFYVLIA